MYKTALNTGLLLLSLSVLTPLLAAADCHPLLNFQATKLRSAEQVDFCAAFNGKALLVVNTASQCGYTPQFDGLEKLHQRLGDKLAVVGFPSADFNQEHTDSAEIAKVCQINYGVTFTMLEPSQVTGKGANALFKQLAQRSGQQPGWNFNKYLVSADGDTVMHFGAKVAPDDAALLDSIDAIIAGTD